MIRIILISRIFFNKDLFFKQYQNKVHTNYSNANDGDVHKLSYYTGHDCIRHKFTKGSNYFPSLY